MSRPNSAWTIRFEREGALEGAFLVGLFLLDVLVVDADLLEPGQRPEGDDDDAPEAVVLGVEEPATTNPRTRPSAPMATVKAPLTIVPRAAWRRRPPRVPRARSSLIFGLRAGRRGGWRRVGGAHGEASVLADVVEACAPQHPPPGTPARLPEDHGAGAVGLEARDGEGDEVGGARVLLGDDAGPRGERRDPLEREQLVAQVDEDRAAEDEVEGAVRVLGRGVVDRELDALDARAEDLGGEAEAVSAADVARGLVAPPSRPVEVALVVEVQCGDLGPAALHLERPEAVPGADLERAQAGHVVGSP